MIDHLRRQATICPAEIGHRSVSVCHMGNISLRMGYKTLGWDPKREHFTGENARDANKWLDREKRKPWRV